METIDKQALCPNCFSALGEEDVCPSCGWRAGEERQRGSDCLPLGTVLMGRYRVGQVLGRGGFGVTYLAYDFHDGRRVAIKEYLPDALAYHTAGTTLVASYSGEEREKEFALGAEKFYEEARTVARFTGHPNIVHVYEFFYENNTAYYSMEYIDGCDLKRYVERNGGRLDVERAVRLLLPLLDALILLHSLNVLHRDISPDNIYIGADGTPKLLDFGSARQVLSEQSKSLSVILKPGFAPIEQYQSHGKQGAWTDLYSFGATLYYCVTGEIPANATDRVEKDILVPARKKNPAVSSALDRVLQKAMAVRAANRYQTAAELRGDLLAAAGFEPHKENYFFALMGKLAKKVREKPLPFAAGAVAAAALLILLGSRSVPPLQSGVRPDSGAASAQRGAGDGTRQNEGDGGTQASQTAFWSPPANRGNLTGNYHTDASFAARDGWVYYAAGPNRAQLYRRQEESGETQLLFQSPDQQFSYEGVGVQFVNAAGGQLFFADVYLIRSGTWWCYKIYSMNSDGSELRELYCQDGSSLANLQYYDGWLYFGCFNSKENPLRRMRCDGGNLQEISPTYGVDAEVSFYGSLCFAEDGTCFVEPYAEECIYRLDVESGAAEKLLDVETRYLQEYNGQLYFRMMDKSDLTDLHYEIDRWDYRAGGERSRLLSRKKEEDFWKDNIGFLLCDDNLLLWMWREEAGETKRIIARRDLSEAGGETIKAAEFPGNVYTTDVMAGHPCVLGEWIYYYDITNVPVTQEDSSVISNTPENPVLYTPRRISLADGHIEDLVC